MAAQSAGVVEYADWISAEEEGPTTNEFPGYDTESSDGEAPFLELWGKWNTPSLSLLPGPL